MMIHFTTDCCFTGDGWLAYYEYVPFDQQCTDWFDIATFSITSPDFPVIDCSWVILAPQLSRITVSGFTEVNTGSP